MLFFFGDAADQLKRQCSMEILATPDGGASPGLYVSAVGQHRTPDHGNRRAWPKAAGLLAAPQSLRSAPGIRLARAADTKQMIRRSTSLTADEWRLGIRWAVATTLGWVIGFAICSAQKAFFESLRGDGVVIGVCVGIAQSIALRGRVKHTGWWILATVVGFAAGKFAADAIAESIAGAVGFALGGAAIGIALGAAQWLVLRRQVAQAGVWIPATALAWAVGWSIISTVDEVAGGPTGTTYLIGTTGAAAAGVITGAALIWLRRLGRE